VSARRDAAQNQANGAGQAHGAGQQGDVATANHYLSGSKEMRLVEKAFKSGHYHLEIIHDGNDRYDPATRTVYWDPHSALQTTEGGHQTPALGLGHEMAHATGNRHDNAVLSNTPDARYDTKEERRVILNYENPDQSFVYYGSLLDGAAQDLNIGFSQLPFASPLNGMTPAQAVAWQNLLAGTGIGIGNIAAHELGHQFELPFIDCNKSGKLPCPGGVSPNLYYEYYQEGLPDFSDIGSPLQWTTNSISCINQQLLTKNTICSNQ
jgi:hypothetical protein